MNKNFVLILSLIVLIISCKESVTEPPIDANNSDFFPNSNGNYSHYNISIYDSSGLIQSGVRKSYFKGDTVLLLTTYQVKVDTLELNNAISVNQSYLRKSSSGIFNYVGIDTTGFSGLVPDSLRGGISFDSEYRLIYHPLALNQTWPVYKVRADLIYIEFDFFTIDASVTSKELMTFTFRDTSYTRETYKIEYFTKLITGLNQAPVTFQAHSWIADGIGIIKWEGDSELINFFAGVNIYPTNTSVIEELYSFKTQ